MQIVSIILIFLFESNGPDSSTLKTTDQEKNSEDGENANQGDLQSRQKGSEKNEINFFNNEAVSWRFPRSRWETPDD